MLTSLYVKNYAIIDEIEIHFKSGYNAITGETGAGKSILLGALGLIMGQRSDSKLLYHEDDKCIVEANFRLDQLLLERLPQSEDYDLDKDLVLRREIQPSGKSRAFINDNLVSAGTLKTLAISLIEIHNQFDSLSIISPEYQLDVIDALASNATALADYQMKYAAYNQTRQLLNSLKRQRDKSQTDLDYFAFQLNELEKIDLEELDQQALEEELATLNNSEDIKRILQSAIHASTGSEQSIEEQLIGLSREFQTVANTTASMSKLQEKIEELIELTRDLSLESEAMYDGLNYSEERLTELSELLDHLFALQKKHNVSSLEQLITLRGELREKVQGPEAIEERIAETEKTFKVQLNELTKASQVLTERRKSSFSKICSDIVRMLQKMAMPNARVEFYWQEKTEFTPSGKDDIQLYFSANKGVAPKAVSDIASGGEISRLALCIKSLLASHIRIPILIFDEIDAGISGAVAIKVADILATLASHHQVITITHSPQVAARAGHHLFVHKKDLSDRTVTEVRALSEPQRVDELAKMLSTDPPSEAALSNARELLALVRQ